MNRSNKKFPEEIGKKERRKIRAKKESDRNIWFSLGMFGLVGWSVAVPTLLGIALGVWIDKTWPSRYSWTLTGLVVGLLLGCLNAWFWVQREGKSD
ncbi:MAG: AtpZ/AtpI family protein [Desulfobacterales bacterium]